MARRLHRLDRKNLTSGWTGCTVHPWGLIMPGRSVEVRELVINDYVEPARKTREHIRIRQGDLKAKLVKRGFPVANANQIGTSIEAEKFWRPLGLELCSPKGQSRAADTVYEFRFVDESNAPQAGSNETPERKAHPFTGRYGVTETPSERAFRLTERARGLLKDEIAAFGGTEAFMRWVRSDEAEEDAA